MEKPHYWTRVTQSPLGYWLPGAVSVGVAKPHPPDLVRVKAGWGTVRWTGVRRHPGATAKPRDR